MKIRYIACLAVLVVTGCSRQSPVQLSDTGSFRAFLSVMEMENGFEVWAVNITDTEECTTFTTCMESCPAMLMVYTAWDNEDRLWLYSSDDGSYFYWENDQEDSHWSMYSFDPSSTMEFSPPVSLTSQFTRGSDSRQ